MKGDKEWIDIIVAEKHLVNNRSVCTFLFPRTVWCIEWNHESLIHCNGLCNVKGSLNLLLKGKRKTFTVNKRANDKHGANEVIELNINQDNC